MGLPSLSIAFIHRSPFAVACPHRVPGRPAGERCQHEQGRSRRQLSEGASALADQDAIVLNFGTQARADWRALISAACIGSMVGLSLGAAYLAGGMGPAAVGHSRGERIAEATAGALSQSALRT